MRRARSAGAICRRTSTTSFSRRTTRRRNRSTRTSAASPTTASTSTRVCSPYRATRSRRTSRPGNIGTPGFPNCAPSIYDPTVDPFFGGARCVYDPAVADGVQRDSRAGDDELLRVGALAVQSELAALRHRGLHQGRHPLRHPAQSVFRPDHLGPERRIPVDVPAAAVEPVLPDGACRSRGRRRTTAEPSLPHLCAGTSRHHRRSRQLADRRGRQGHRLELGLRLRLRLQPQRDQLASQRRLRAPLPAPAAVQFRPGESLRTADTRGAGRARRTPVPGGDFQRKVHRLAVRGQGDRGSFQASGGKRGSGGRLPDRQAGARAAVPSGAPGGRRHRIRRHQPGYQRGSRLLGGVRGSQHSGRQEPRVESCGPLRRLQRLRQHDESEGFGALESGEADPSARLVGNRLRRAHADAGLRREHGWHHAARTRGSAALPDDAGHERLRHPVRRALRRQSQSEAAEVGPVDRRIRLRTDLRRLAGVRLVQSDRRGPVQQRSDTVDDPQ